ncbi:MAG: GCN5-related N-acetyltransferase [Patescibacteria group bacterium]|jgi:ASC-1-like (ASCH) protein/predicted N-acetyltransferase YhbS|nr:GCN5-related N-acetyltransferase [Patescibacteria group bacterium]
MQSKKLPFVIREAQSGDFCWLAELMDVALTPYYDGDHRAHAERIFSTHISGGRDHIGHFSFEQKMFIAEINNRPAGLIHMVGKRQKTYKISPLIVDPEFQGTSGIGSALLEYGERYAVSKNARQVYCTVAEKNRVAYNFFVRKGYVSAGGSDNHYKTDSREVMLYKPLESEKSAHERDQLHISVIPFEDKYKEKASGLILRSLPQWFDGIDDEWVESLFAGYNRRKSADINTKYKLIYVAVDQSENVLGIVGITPKKGQPIKLMPFIAETDTAFEAFLHDLPYMLAEYGHKLYTHLHPTVEEAIALQRLGWRADSLMPGAYRSNVITQQWGFNLKETIMRDMRVKKRYFDLIKNGSKDLEVRVGYSSIKRITKGEKINLATHDENMVIVVEDVRIYKSFADMLKAEKAERIAPGVAEQEVLPLLQEIYPPHKESLGIYVLQIKVD